LFQTKIGFIKNGIYDQIESQNLYVCNILFRTIIEHYLKAEYILIQLAKQNNDNVGIDYYNFGDASELLQLGSAYKKVGEILYPEKKFGNIFDLLKEKYPHLNNYKQSDISKEVSKYKYRNIIEYLYNSLYTETNELGKSENFLVNLIPKYSDLSSFVHGGSSADTAIMSIMKSGKSHINEEITEIFFQTVLLCLHFNNLLYLISIKYDKEYEQYYLKTSELIDELLKLKT